jgi:dihydrofolate synthase / folylpolyglutamate synthase
VVNVKGVKTSPIRVGDSITDILDRFVPVLSDKAILAITSKVISLCEGSVVAKDAVLNKKELIIKEADAYLDKDTYGFYLTIKNNILIPSAGIDESNGDGVYILYPRDSQKSAAQIWHHLRKKHSLKNLGIIITDSTTTPLRKGVTGISLGWCGFKALHSYVGKPDIFGHPLQVTQINLLDALAASAVYVMGEGNEQTPIAIIEEAPKIEFLDTPPSYKETLDIQISLEEDIYAPLLNQSTWIWHGK